jgi:spore coat protein JB
MIFAFIVETSKRIPHIMITNPILCLIRRNIQVMMNKAEKPTPISAAGRPHVIDNGMTGSMPQVGYLANTYVPMQQPGRMYSKEEALPRGTLFPGLDLPFQNRVNAKMTEMTPLTEIMALDFACHELKLYLDVHTHDREALELLESYVKMSDEARKVYGGTLSIRDPMSDGYSWISQPWPWEMKGTEG